ncbi:unnamed protein product [Vitrella brassicaformis CCMP3155]|uniref:Uncharacterized protein n=1 Tax=Vitrella brassicaformis (strain CCMP3155) TaxID=1169540 RepID=A0A0G4FYC4_VITBC|nr:unnamed protein product [Vitrella brassicaformis CCMP3155]|eukprot:CEM20436.1 unnamed protein product [Vitrella brassicaformis CCMP3155]
MSSFVKSIVLGHFEGTHQINYTTSFIDRHVDNHRLHTIVTQSPHTPVRDAPQQHLRVWVITTESAVSGVGSAFKDRFPQTTQLARVVLGDIISAILFDGAPKPGQQPEDDSDEDSDSDDLDDNDDFDGDDDDMEDDWEDSDDDGSSGEGSRGGEAAAASASASASVG